MNDKKVYVEAKYFRSFWKFLGSANLAIYGICHPAQVLTPHPRLRNEWTAKGSESRKKVWLSMVRTTSPSVWYLQRQILKLSMVGYLHNKDPSKKVGQKVHGFNPSTPTYHRHHQWQWSSHHHHPPYCHQGLPTHSIIIIIFVNNRNA